MMRQVVTAGTARRTLGDGVHARTGTAQAPGTENGWLIGYRGDLAVGCWSRRRLRRRLRRPADPPTPPRRPLNLSSPPGRTPPRQPNPVTFSSAGPPACADRAAVIMRRTTS